MKQVQRRWKNMRDCLRRELHLQKQTKSGDPGTKRWKYMHFEQMLFLIPLTQDCATSSNYSPMTGSDGEEDTDERREGEQGSSGGASETSTCRKQQCESNASRKINYKQHCWTSWRRRVTTSMRIKSSCCLLYQPLKKWTMTRSTGQKWKCWALGGKPKIWCFSHRLHSVLQLLYHRHMIIISNTKPHQQCEIFQKTSFDVVCTLRHLTVCV